jgi:UMF1 family MFS transporter
VRRLLETLRELRRYKQAFLLLLAFLIYNDGIQTIIRMATIYGTEIGLDDNAMIVALLITQFIGIPFAFLFGMLAQRIGAKTAVFGGLAVYAVITVLGYFMTHVDAVLRAGDPGRHGAGRHAGAEPIALRQHDPEAQVVGVLRVLRRVRALCRRAGPGGVRVGRGHTGTSRNAILSVLAFFVIGALL